MERLFILVLILILFLVGCGGVRSESQGVASIGLITYYYDEAHDVCIWTWKSGPAGGMAVLPAREVRNPHSPIAIKGVQD